MQDSILGARIRQRRRETAITQAELARRIGISASYLNLIEMNKRRIAGGLMVRIAEALDLSLDDLEGAAEKRLYGTLSGVARQPVMRKLGVEGERTSELIGRFPGWAKALGELSRTEREATERAQRLSERLANDPHLSETLHRMLTRIAAVRSTTEILTGYADLPDDRRQRFTNILQEEIASLSEVGEALAAYLDRTDHAEPVLTPVDEVASLFAERGNRFPEIDEAAQPLTAMLSDSRFVSRRQAARHLSHDALGPLIETLIGEQAQIRTAAARGRAQRLLSDYAFRAVLMPMDAFAPRAAQAHYDIEVLAEDFGVEVEEACQRLTALPRAEDVPRFGYFRANAAGAITAMLELDGLSVPRYATGCPLWVLFRAQQSPDAVMRQRVLFPSGERFVFVARARNTGPSGFGKPRHYISDMIAMTEADAALTVYDPDPSSTVEEVGPSCRLCPRETCLHRVEDPLAE